MKILRNENGSALVAVLAVMGVIGIIAFQMTTMTTGQYRDATNRDTKANYKKINSTMQKAVSQASTVMANEELFNDPVQ